MSSSAWQRKKELNYKTSEEEFQLEMSTNAWMGWIKAWYSSDT